VVEDTTERGDFTGQRTDIVTYMCETAGTYHLPALSLPWFDLDDAQLKRVELPAVTLEVAANPQLAPDGAQAPPTRSTTRAWWWVGGLVVVVLIAAWLLRRFYRPLATRLSRWRNRRAARETAYFARLQTACQSGDPATAFNAFTHWIDRFYDGDASPTIDQFVHDADDTDLRRQVEQLERQLFATPAAPHEAWSGQAFYQCLATVRKRLQQRAIPFHLRAQQALPPLNPSANASLARRLRERPDNRAKGTPA
jgi:hypothetical protein